MNYFKPFPGAGFLALSLLIAAGCSKPGASAPTPLAADKIPDAVNQAFAGAPEETRQQVASVVTDVQAKDSSTAFVDLQSLSARPNLSPLQRQIVVRAMQTTLQQVRSDATNGNPTAQKVLHQYISTR